jgi:hypothetical protein
MMLAGVMIVAGATAADAQCPSGNVQDACQKATDLLRFMTPQLSTALAGGNPTLGQGGVLGGLGHFSLDIRASGVSGTLPKLDNISPPLTAGSARASTFTSNDKIIPFPSLDLGVGLWKGVSLGVTHVGGIDGLVTATIVPDFALSRINSGGGSSALKTTLNGSSTQLGFGFRVGLLEEGALWPGASFVWAQRSLPSLSVNGTIPASGLIPASDLNPGGTLALNDFTVKTSVWRITAAKNLLILNISAGFGQDKYDASSTVSATVNGSQPVTVSTPFSMTRTNYFVGAAINLFLFKVEGEYGQVSGGTVPTLLNNFGSDPNGSRSYFTLGLRFGL